MYKFLLSVTISGSLVMAAHAQNREIKFNHDTPFKTVLEEAKKENKLIFFDAYTTWCGPCKEMANTVFKTDSVADFFNQSFVNLKVDMEKGEGPKLKDQFGISAYPTLLFIDGDGNVVHKLVGSSPAGEFMVESRKALNPDKTVFGLAKKFNAGDHSPELLIAYMTALETAYEHVKMGEVAKVYFDTFPKETLLESANWEMESRFLFDVSSKAFAYLHGKTTELSELYGKQKVSMYFGQVFSSTISGLKKSYTTKENLEAAKVKAKAMETLLGEKSDAVSKRLLFSLHLTQLAGTKQWDQYCGLIDKTLRLSAEGKKPDAYTVLWSGMEMINAAPEKNAGNALKWADYYSVDKDLFTSILVSDLRKMANTKMGKAKEAQESALNSERLRKEAGEKGQMTPPIMKP